jgi:hypothetical protein
LIRAIRKIRIQKAFSCLVPARPGWGFEKLLHAGLEPEAWIRRKMQEFSRLNYGYLFCHSGGIPGLRHRVARRAPGQAFYFLKRHLQI